MSATTKYGRTALHVAAASGQEEIIETLLEYGAGKTRCCTIFDISMYRYQKETQ